MCEYCNEPYKNMSVREGISKSENQSILPSGYLLCSDTSGGERGGLSCVWQRFDGGISMKQSIAERVEKLKIQLDNRPSRCKHCKLEIENGIAEFICERTERHTFFGTKADKCYRDCDLYEKDIPEMIEDTIYFMLKKQIEKLKSEKQNTETENDVKSFERGYSQCQKDILKIVDELSKIRRKP